MYVRPYESKVDTKLNHKLVAFERVFIKTGESRKLHISIPHEAVAVWKEGSKGETIKKINKIVFIFTLKVIKLVQKVNDIDRSALITRCTYPNFI